MSDHRGTRRQPLQGNCKWAAAAAGKMRLTEHSRRSRTSAGLLSFHIVSSGRLALIDWTRTAVERDGWRQLPPSLIISTGGDSHLERLAGQLAFVPDHDALEAGDRPF